MPSGADPVAISQPKETQLHSLANGSGAKDRTEEVVDRPEQLRASPAAGT